MHATTPRQHRGSRFITDKNMWKDVNANKSLYGNERETPSTRSQLKRHVRLLNVMDGTTHGQGKPIPSGPAPAVAGRRAGVAGRRWRCGPALALAGAAFRAGASPGRRRRPCPGWRPRRPGFPGIAMATAVRAGAPRHRPAATGARHPPAGASSPGPTSRCRRPPRQTTAAPGNSAIPGTPPQSRAPAGCPSRLRGPKARVAVPARWTIEPATTGSMFHRAGRAW